jgi:hypothetical protein
VERPFEIADRPLRLAEILAGVAEVVERVGRAWSERERPLVACHRLSEPPLFPENVAEIVVKRRIAAVPRDCFADMLDRDVVAPELTLDQAEQMKGLGMIGVDHEDLTANPLRLGGASRTLMAEGCVEPLGDRPRCPRRAIRSPPGLGAPLLSVHLVLIAQPAATYPPARENCQRRCPLRRRAQEA